ncbi:drug:H+ antiporter-2 (14 Spanner) (DHA2) family drug resistance MFS transporter [Enterococcus canis]|uniref:Drug:H+ antiporter-2 (14 Spanner) (DHA2) family drug resistance MFS transporter n=1 Tax=Enterococcus canis TaxID=214095 RepID=A0A1L8RJL6_9ENTE|nr:MDR family MFS transporter [Enterococcus canis]OJG19943.1 drug:H+ antiporter-2 (14 Spanner) (DHA2) family drug resistance MFS transporter [Enterococcus canis]
MSQSTKLPQGVLGAAWAIALGAIAPMLDSTMMNIAIEQLNTAFSTSLSTVQWAITGYVLALAIAVPIAGWLMNRFDGKLVFITAVAIFGLTSLIAGFSWNITSFIIFRLFQGFSAGIITPLMSTLLVKTAGPDNIGKVISIVTTPMIFGPILGPVLGGFILEIANWRWLFFINVLILLIALPLMIRYIPHFAPFNPKARLDWRGILLLSISSALLIFGISKAADHATFFNQETVATVGMGLILLVAYLWHDHQQHHEVVLPLTLFTHKPFRIASIGLFLANIAIMGPMLILPLFFQTFRHYTAMQAALALIPQGIGMLLTRPVIGRMIDKIGARYVVLVSLVLALLGSIPLAFLTPKTSLVLLSVILFIRGASVGGINLPLTTDAYTGLADTQLPEAGVGINMIENLGSSFGSALITTVVSTNLIPLKGYQAGFAASVVVLILLIIPSLFLTKKMTTLH